MLKVIFVVFGLFSFFSEANGVVVCTKGKVSIGDSYDKYISYCGQPKRSEHGMRILGKNNNITSFSIIKKRYPDKSTVSFIFLDKKLAFILD